jgi:hypothetical protein
MGMYLIYLHENKTMKFVDIVLRRGQENEEE